MTNYTRLIDGVRFKCSKCNKLVTPIAKILNDVDTTETKEIQFECLECGLLLKVMT